jgi:predicted dienelactone hydrolase
MKAAVWYPSAAPNTAFAYSPDISSSLAKDGQPLTGCGTFPLVIFSHGLLGCGDQSIFFTETLARYGYVVVAPDHQDALLCSVDGKISLFPSATEPPILDPQTWTDTSYVQRKDGIETTLNWVLQDDQLKPLIDVNEIGIAGHSLGGYTALAMVGGWASWKDSRFKAALLMSPYSLPFSASNTLKGVTVPLMYQGAELDIGITPFVDGRLGAYAQSNPPKYFVKLRGGNHFTWSNAVCAGYKVVADCLQAKPSAALIDEYGIAFFEQYLKGKTQPALTQDNSALSKFEFQP